MTNNISKKRLRQREEALKRGLPELIYESFDTYAEYMIPKWTEEQLPWEWFHHDIANNYQKVLDGETHYFSVEMVPQSGKSALCTLFITYLMALKPNLHIIYATHSEDRAIEVTKEYIFGWMDSEKYRIAFPHIVLKSDMTNSGKDGRKVLKRKQMTLKDNSFTLADQNDNLYRGTFRAIGIGQGQHGRPADYYIIDDYVGKADNIMGLGFRTKLTRWFLSDVISRFQPSTRVIMNCTRWYLDDPIGILQKKSEDITKQLVQMGGKPPVMVSLKIPAEYRQDKHTSPNDPRDYTDEKKWLWKAQIVKYLLAKGGMDYEANYNCNPEDTDSKKQIHESDFGLYDELPQHGGRFIFSIDGASTIKATSDHTAIGYWYVAGVKRYLVKLWYIKKEVLQLIHFVRELLDTYEYSQCLIEYANSGVALYHGLTTRDTSVASKSYANILALSFTGLPVGEKDISNRAITRASNSKIDRYIRILDEFRYNDRRVLIPRNKIEHQDEFVRQMTTFDGVDGKADDLVDMTTYLLYFTQKTIIQHNNSPVAQNNLTHNKYMNYNMGNNRLYQKSLFIKR